MRVKVTVVTAILAAGLFAFGLAGGDDKTPPKKEAPAKGAKGAKDTAKPASADADGDKEKGKDKDKEKPLTFKKSASSAVAAAAKGLSKAKCYRVTVEIEGGLSDREDHEITEKTLSESYEGEVYLVANSPSGPLMHVPSVGKIGAKAFRYPKKGAAYVDGQWRDILANATTMRMQKLFGFPETYLARALSYGSAQWVVTDADREEARKKAEEKAEEAKKEADTAADDGKASPGKTVSRKALKAAQDAAAEIQPHLVRVDVPPKEAVMHFTEVQNSNCFGGG